MASYTNQATLFTSNGISLSNVAQGQLNEVLTATKTAVMNDYTVDDQITYVLTLVNAGGTPMTGLTVSDDLGTYTFGATTLEPLDYTVGSVQYYQNGVLQPDPSLSIGPPLVFNNITVPANGNTMLIYEATTNVYAPINTAGSIENTATITGTGVPNPLTASVIVDSANVADLSISKWITPVPVTEGGTVTYSFIIQNSGNTIADASYNIVVSDTFNPAITITSVTLNGAPFTAYAYTGGVFATTAGSITVPAATITQDATTGIWLSSPGSVTLQVVGTV